MFRLAQADSHSNGEAMRLYTTLLIGIAVGTLLASCSPKEGSLMQINSSLQANLANRLRGEGLLEKETRYKFAEESEIEPRYMDVCELENACGSEVILEFRRRFVESLEKVRNIHFQNEVRQPTKMIYYSDIYRFGGFDFIVIAVAEYRAEDNSFRSYQGSLDQAVLILDEEQKIIDVRIWSRTKDF